MEKKKKKNQCVLCLYSLTRCACVLEAVCYEYKMFHAVRRIMWTPESVSTTSLNCPTDNPNLFLWCWWHRRNSKRKKIGFFLRCILERLLHRASAEESEVTSFLGWRTIALGRSYALKWLARVDSFEVAFWCRFSTKLFSTYEMKAASAISHRPRSFWIASSFDLVILSFFFWIVFIFILHIPPVFLHSLIRANTNERTSSHKPPSKTTVFSNLGALQEYEKLVLDSRPKTTKSLLWAFPKRSRPSLCWSNRVCFAFAIASRPNPVVSPTSQHLFQQLVGCFDRWWLSGDCIGEISPKKYPIKKNLTGSSRKKKWPMRPFCATHNSQLFHDR